MSWLRQIAEYYDNPADFMWRALACVCGGFLVFQTYPNPVSVFHLLMLVFNLSGIVIIPLAFKGMVEDVADWEEETELPKVGTFTLASVAGIAILSFILGVFTGEMDPATKLPFKSAIWVPTMLYPLSTETLATSGGLYSFFMDIFATIFSVVPGEESLVELFSPLFRAYEDFSWASAIPYAFQPAVLIGRVVWATWHIIKGQYPFFFFFTVLGAGIILDYFTAKSGTTLTKRVGHGGWNCLVQVGKFVRGGYLTVTVG